MPKIKTLYLCIALPFLILALALLLALRAKINTYISGHPEFTGAPEKSAKAALPNHIGEKITYDVKMGKLRLGKAEFSNLANKEVDGRLLNTMTMETKLANFKDTEMIYSDPETLLPVRVERDILNFMSREKITEEYDQNDFSVNIIKHKGAKEQKLVIKKEGSIHNAVLLPFYVRQLPALEVGKTITANLPLRSLELKLVSIEEIGVPAGTFNAYHFQSTPKQTEIWISADERRIPLKIQGSGILGYSLVMREYTPGS